MKVEFATTGSGEPQFVIKAENDQDRQLLSMFVNFGERQKGYKFHLHGYCYEFDYSSTTSMNFGWIKPRKKTLIERLKRLIHL